jgi:hypothetical protein
MTTTEDIRDLLQSALQALETPTLAALKRAERLTEDANAAIRELTDPPDPYKDTKLRPGLVTSEPIDERLYRTGDFADPEKGHSDG